MRQLLNRTIFTKLKVEGERVVADELASRSTPSCQRHGTTLVPATDEPELVRTVPTRSGSPRAGPHLRPRLGDDSAQVRGPLQ